MRAKRLAIMLACAVTLLAPVAKADCVKTVDKLLGYTPAETVVIEQAAVVDNCPPAPAATVIETTTTMPVVITTLIPVPDDLNIRQRELKMKIDDKLAEGSITSSEASSLKTAMSHVDAVEADFRSDGHLSYKESKKLYRAMDQVGSDLDFMAEDPSIFGLPLRTGHFLRNWEI